MKKLKFYYCQRCKKDWAYSGFMSEKRLIGIEGAKEGEYIEQIFYIEPSKATPVKLCPHHEEEEAMEEAIDIIVNDPGKEIK